MEITKVVKHFNESVSPIYIYMILDPGQLKKQQQKQTFTGTIFFVCMWWWWCQVITKFTVPQQNKLYFSCESPIQIDGD